MHVNRSSPALVLQGQDDGLHLDAKTVQIAQQENAFIPSAAFDGARPGFEFSTGTLGTGYYTTDQTLLSSVLDQTLVQGSPSTGELLWESWSGPALEPLLIIHYDTATAPSPKKISANIALLLDYIAVVAGPLNLRGVCRSQCKLVIASGRESWTLRFMVSVSMQLGAKFTFTEQVLSVEPLEAKASEGWDGMKTVAQLRREQGVGAPRNPDSLYRPIERAPRKFNPMKIPKSLQVMIGTIWSPLSLS